MLRRRLPAVLSVLALAATAALLVPAGASAAAPAATAGKTYVALGDSYAAGFGLPATVATPTGKPVAGCEQTTGDYPHLLATRLGLTLTDVTCSGATTADFSAPQSVTGGSAPAQLDVFKTVQPALVTITIGGNDLGFTTIAANCLAGGKAGPLLLHSSFSSCSAYYNSTASGGGKAQNPYDELAATVAKVSAAIKAVQAAAPHAKVAVIAYPAIAPDRAHTPAAGCFTANALVPPVALPGLPITVASALPFTDTDIPYLQALQQQLDSGIGSAARADGAAYADVYPTSLAHSACQPETTRWVEPIVPGNVGGTNVLHPNIAGTSAMAATLAPVVTALLTPAAASTAPSTSAVPSSPAAAASSSTAPPLASTGSRVPIGWLVGVAAVLLVGGGVSLRVGRRH